MLAADRCLSYALIAFRRYFHTCYCCRFQPCYAFIDYASLLTFITMLIFRRQRTFSMLPLDADALMVAA